MVKRIVLSALVFCSLFVHAFSKERAQQQMMVQDVENVLYRGNGTLIIQQGPISQVILEGSKDELEGAALFVEEHTLVIKEKKKWLDFFRPRVSTFKCTVTLQDLESLTLEGSCMLNIESFNVRDFTCIIRDNAQVDMNLKGDSLALYIISHAEVKASGRIGNQNVLISSDGVYRAEDLYSDACQIVLEGAAVAYVNAKESLDVKIDSTGIVHYSGAPRKIQSTISGPGQILLIE